MQFLCQARSFILIVFLTAVLLISCTSKPSPEQQLRDVTQLPTCFPVIERLKLMEYGTGAQEIFHYRRGYLSRSGSRRTYFDGETRTRKPFPPFDTQAQKDLAELEGSLAKTGVRVTHISMIRYDARGKLLYAEFSLPSSLAPLRYVYSPNYGEIPDATEGQRFTPINRDWYFMVDDAI